MKQTLLVLSLVTVIFVGIKFLDKNNDREEISPSHQAGHDSHLDEDFEGQFQTIDDFSQALIKYYGDDDREHVDYVGWFTDNFFQRCRGQESCLELNRPIIKAICQQKDFLLGEPFFWDKYFEYIVYSNQQNYLSSELSHCQNSNQSLLFLRYLKMASGAATLKYYDVVDHLREVIAPLNLEGLEIKEGLSPEYDHYSTYSYILSLLREKNPPRDIVSESLWTELGVRIYSQRAANLISQEARNDFETWLRMYSDVMRITGRLDKVISLFSLEQILDTFKGRDTPVTWVQSACDYWVVSNKIDACAVALDQILQAYTWSPSQALRIDFYKLRLHWFQANLPAAIKASDDLTNKYVGSITPLDELLLNLTMADIYKSMKEYPKALEYLQRNKWLLGDNGSWQLAAYGELAQQSIYLHQKSYREAYDLGQNILTIIDQNIKGVSSLQAAVVYHQILAAISLKRETDVSELKERLKVLTNSMPVFNYYHILIKAYESQGAEKTKYLLEAERLLGKNHAFINDFKNF